MCQPPAPAMPKLAVVVAIAGLWLVAGLPWPRSAWAVAVLSAFMVWRYLRVRSMFERAVRAMAHRDPLTGLPDRLALRSHLATPAGPEPGRAALLVLDLDGFRQL